jgi:hypothetical protein
MSSIVILVLALVLIIGFVRFTKEKHQQKIQENSPEGETEKDLEIPLEESEFIPQEISPTEESKKVSPAEIQIEEKPKRVKSSTTKIPAAKKEGTKKPAAKKTTPKNTNK